MQPVSTANPSYLRIHFQSKQSVRQKETFRALFKIREVTTRGVQMSRDSVVVAAMLAFTIWSFGSREEMNAQAKPKPEVNRNATEDYVFRSTVRRVPVDVVVLDKQ